MIKDDCCGNDECKKMPSKYMVQWGGGLLPRIVEVDDVFGQEVGAYWSAIEAITAEFKKQDSITYEQQEDATERHRREISHIYERNSVIHQRLNELLREHTPPPECKTVKSKLVKGEGGRE